MSWLLYRFLHVSNLREETLSNSTELPRIMTLLHTVSSVVGALMSVITMMKLTLLENRNNRSNNQNHNAQLQPSLKPVITLQFNELSIVYNACEQLAEVSNKLSAYIGNQSIPPQSTQADAVVLSANIVCDIVGFIALASDPIVEDSFEVW